MPITSDDNLLGINLREIGRWAEGELRQHHLQYDRVLSIGDESREAEQPENQKPQERRPLQHHHHQGQQRKGRKNRQLLAFATTIRGVPRQTSREFEDEARADYSSPEGLDVFGQFDYQCNGALRQQLVDRHMHHRCR